MHLRIETNLPADRIPKDAVNSLIHVVTELKELRYKSVGVTILSKAEMAKGSFLGDRRIQPTIEDDQTLPTAQVRVYDIPTLVMEGETLKKSVRSAMLSMMEIPVERCFFSYYHNGRWILDKEWIGKKR